MALTPKITLNPGLDPKKLRAAFFGARRLHIPGIINEDAADAVHRSLNRDIAWNIAYNDDAGQQDLFASQQQQMSANERNLFHQKILARAKAGKFTYLYGSFAIGDLYKKGREKDLYLARMFEFVNSKEVLGFIRTVTGHNSIKHATMQATAYGPGHFLTDHNDFDPKKDRKVAYVFNFTRDWKAEWGGILQFLSEDGIHERGLVPSFNALNIFAVPQRHIVSQVTTFAPRPRFALTGWFMGTEDD